MNLRDLLLTSLIFTGLNACNFDVEIDERPKENMAQDMETPIADESEETSVSQSKATLEMTIDGENYDSNCNEHYLNIAKEGGEDMHSYSLRINMDENENKITVFQLSFKEKGKIELPYEVELDFKKSATDNKLKTYLTVHYLDENDKVVQTSNDVGTIIITEMNEEKVTLEVDTKLLLLNTVNIKGEGETVELKGKIQSTNPIITMMGGAEKEDVF